MIGVEVVDCTQPRRSSADERVDPHVFSKKCRCDAKHLVGVVLADDALAGTRVVRSTDAGEKKKTHVVHLKRGQNNQVGGLLQLLPVLVDVHHSRRPRLGGILQDPRYIRAGSHLKIGSISQNREDRRLRGGLGVEETAKALAITAQIARSHTHAVGVRERNGAIRRRHGERAVAELGRGLLKELRRVDGRKRWSRKLIATGTFEGIADRSHGASKVSGNARHSADLFEVIEVRFELRKRDRIVLNGHLRRNEMLAVALLNVAAEEKIFGRCAPELPIPVHAGTTYAVAEHKGAVLSIRYGGVIDRVSNGHCLGGQRLPEFPADSMAKLISDSRILKIR